MKKYKLNAYFLNLLLSYILICLSYQFDIKDEFKQEDDSYFDYTLKPGKVQIKYLNYTNANPFIFKNEIIHDNFLVNFYSPSCNIELIRYSSPNIILLNLTENFISMKIKKYFYTTEMFIQEKVNLINGINKYKDIKNCPLIINTINDNQLSLSLEKNEPTILYFYENFKKINLPFQIKEFGFIALSFSLNNVSEFNIIIPDIINTTISNSTTIYLDNDTLNNIEEKILNIGIEHIGSNPCLLTFQIIEPKSVSILQRDFINKGFIDTNHENLYYFMEVFEEEGEIMLNNKRQSGKLFGFIKDKEGINPYNTSKYIQNDIDNKDNQLEFNEHTQKLSFNYEHTKNCEKGCYLFLTYYNKKEENITVIGYEYTLLVRIWDVEDFGPQIINIPFNEYIFGTFEKNSFISHYYSIFIPQGIKEIIIQIENNFVEGFFRQGKEKLPYRIK